MLQRIGVYGVIFKRMKDTPLFLLVDWNGKGGFPGGGKKPKETLEQAFLRETKEELGIRKNDFKFFFLTEFKKEFISNNRKGWKEHKEIHRYFFGELKPKVKIFPSPEIPGIVWLPLEKAKKFLFWESSRKIFVNITNYYQKTIRKIPFRIVVGIPAHNEEYNLPKCIKALNQSVSFLKTKLPAKIKTIIAENASTDNTLKIAQKLKTKFPQLAIEVISVKHKGMVNAENLIIKRTKPEDDFIFFIDADAFLKKDALYIIIREFLKHPELKIVGGHPKPIPYRGKNILKILMDKILNIRGYFPQSEIAKNDVKEYHQFAQDDPQSTIPVKFELKSKIYFHGRFFALAGKEIWNLPKDERRIGDDTFLTNSTYERFGPRAIRVRYDAVCYSAGIKSLIYHFKTYGRIWVDKKQLYKDYPQWKNYRKLCETKLDWNYIFTLPLKNKIFFLLYFLIQKVEFLLFPLFFKEGNDYWQYKKEKNL